MNIDREMTVDEWVNFFAVMTVKFSLGIFIAMCGVAIMKVAGVF